MLASTLESEMKCDGLKNSSRDRAGVVLVIVSGFFQTNTYANTITGCSLAVRRVEMLYAV
jgi:hypothetical protein